MKIIAANFKMNGNREFIESWFKSFSSDTSNQIIVGIPNIYLELAIKNSSNTNIKIAGQNVSEFSEAGAFTGQVSAEMLNDIEIEFCIIGHSEAREYLKEEDSDIFKKYNALKNKEIAPIVCIGESLAVRESSEHLEFISNQLSEFTAIDDEIIFAYEPIWAIGTGLVPSKQQIEEMSDHIKSLFKQSIKVLYGGSVNSKNASEILSMKNIDGVLVGGASLNAEEFANIAQS